MEKEEELRKDLDRALSKASVLVRRLPTPGRKAEKYIKVAADRFDQLADQLYTPCIVAVVGQVKAGKSAFINALLHNDVAKVGTAETTTAITFFCYGRTDEERPIRCVKKNGQKTEESLGFFNSLQGTDSKTLRLAKKIDHLEFNLLNDHLKGIILVDTPGTEARIPAHQDTTTEFMRLRDHLTTKTYRETADAVIYLMDRNPSEHDETFLQQFRQNIQQGSRVLNAVAVISKVDLYDAEALEKREEFANEVAKRLGDCVNTVVPVSAGLRRALDTLPDTGLGKLIQSLSKLRNHKDILDKILSDKRLYDSPKLDGPLPIQERQELLHLWEHPIEWRVFVTIARRAAEADPSQSAQVRRALNTIAGFDQLDTVLQEHILMRGRLLRYYRILNEALDEVQEIKEGYGQGPPIERQEKTRDRLMAVLRKERDREELEQFIQKNLVLQATQVKEVIAEMEQDFSKIRKELNGYNEDFAIFRRIAENPNSLTEQEKEEFKWLATIRNTPPPPQNVSKDELEKYNQQHVKWQHATQALDDTRRYLADWAWMRYSDLIRYLNPEVARQR